ncbi:MAG: hypothetical protein AAGA68_03840 [Pseudomonadota bacterium]
MAQGAVDNSSARVRQRLTLAIVCVVLMGSANAQDTSSEAEAARAASRPAENEAEEASDAQFLAFLEYLGSWEESDEEWQAFHPDEGLSEIRLPAPHERNARSPADGNEDTWDENGRS